jgi:hypothetical protein
LSEVASHLCNPVKTAKDYLVNMAVKKEGCPLNKYLLKETINIFPDLLRQLQPFDHTINSHGSQLDNLKNKKFIYVSGIG